MSRRIALRILVRVEKEGLFAAPLLDRYLERSDLSPLDKGLATELVYGVLRWQGRLDGILSPYLRYPLQKMDPTLRYILRVGAYQLLFLDRIPAFAAVDEAVKMAASHIGPRQGDFVNAVLRQIARVPPRMAAPDSSLGPPEWALYFSHPEDLIRTWIRHWGAEEAAAFLEANNQIPYLGVQVNTLKGDGPGLKRALMEETGSITAEEGKLVPHFFRAHGLGEIRHTRVHREGRFQVMDEASALIPYLLDPRPGDEILDACAGKGGKAAVLAQLMEDQGRITALDSNHRVLEALKENSLRLGIHIIEPLWGDARDSQLMGKRRFDKILLDAPCSGLGTLRRHPEIKWRKPLSSVPALQALQLSLLEGVAAYLQPGGVLLYSTCSPQPEEDEEVVGSFLRSHSSFRAEDVSPYLPKPAAGAITSQGYLRTFPHRHGVDAFFGARLRRCEN